MMVDTSSALRQTQSPPYRLKGSTLGLGITVPPADRTPPWRLEATGADVVGVNCHRRPATMMPVVKRIRRAVKCVVAALPVPNRTTRRQPSLMSLTDPCCGNARAFPTGLDPFLCTRPEMGEFGRQAFDVGIRYLGICCGAGPAHIPALAEALGRQTERYTLLSIDLINSAVPTGQDHGAENNTTVDEVNPPGGFKTSRP